VPLNVACAHVGARRSSPGITSVVARTVGPAVCSSVSSKSMCASPRH
jgi:hypothetical protein